MVKIHHFRYFLNVKWLKIGHFETRYVFFSRNNLFFGVKIFRAKNFRGYSNFGFEIFGILIRVECFRWNSFSFDLLIFWPKIFGFTQNTLWMWCKMIFLNSYNGGVKLQYFQVCTLCGYSILWQLLYCNFSYSKMVISDIITLFTIWWFIFYFNRSPQRWHATLVPVMKNEKDQGSAWKPIPKSTKKVHLVFPPFWRLIKYSYRSARQWPIRVGLSDH